MLELKALGSDLPGIARLAIANFLHTNARVDLGRPGAPRAPVFVTLRSLDGSLRGCIGSLIAIEPDVASETARSAVLAATRDPRFPPVRSEELQKLHIEVSVLLPEEPVTNFDELDPQRYGVVVRDDSGRQGLLLPEVPGVDTAELQVEIARRKAGIEPEASVTMRRFEVVKFSE